MGNKTFYGDGLTIVKEYHNVCVKGYVYLDVQVKHTNAISEPLICFDLLRLGNRINIKP